MSTGQEEKQRGVFYRRPAVDGAEPADGALLELHQITHRLDVVVKASGIPVSVIVQDLEALMAGIDPPSPAKPLVLAMEGAARGKRRRSGWGERWAEGNEREGEGHGRWARATLPRLVWNGFFGEFFSFLFFSSTL